MSHRYVHVTGNTLKGEAIIEGDFLNDWFEINLLLANRMAAASNYWIVYYVDDTTITDKAMVQEDAREAGNSEVAHLLTWPGVQLVIVGE